MEVIILVLAILYLVYMLRIDDQKPGKMYILNISFSISVLLLITGCALGLLYDKVNFVQFFKVALVCFTCGLCSYLCSHIYSQFLTSPTTSEKDVNKCATVLQMILFIMFFVLAKFGQLLL